MAPRLATGEEVWLLEADPDLAAGVPPDEVSMLARVTAPVLRLEPAMHWTLPPLPDATAGLLVLDGLLSRRVQLGGRSSVELLGAGDLVRPWQHDAHAPTIPRVADWRVREPVTAAVLEPRVIEAIGRTAPAVLTELLARSVRRAHALCARLAIVQMPRLEDRLLALFWHLADRWGRVDRDGVLLPLPLSHATLAELVAAQRPSVSIALKQLTEERRIAREAEGGWRLLEAAPPARLVRASNWAPTDEVLKR
jgi:CRP-like cAMP-binding protein